MEIDKQLILLQGTIKFLSHGLHVNRSTTVQHIGNCAVTLYYLEDHSDKFAMLSQKHGSD